LKLPHLGVHGTAGGQRSRPVGVTRRRLMLQLSSLAAAALGGVATAGRTAPLLRSEAFTGAALELPVLGPMSGDVTPDSALIWARGNGPASLAVELATSEEFRDPRYLPSQVLLEERDFTAVVTAKGLTPGTRYFYRVAIGLPEEPSEAVFARARAAGQSDLPSGSFVTAPAPEVVAPVRFTWGGDLGAEYRPFYVADAIAGLKPDFHIMLGDTIYADQGWPATDLNGFRRKYHETLSDLPLRRLQQVTSIYAIWDDHEVTNDFDSTCPLLPAGRQAFFEYWPIRRSPDEPNRLYRSFRWGKLVEVFILDTRQYRSPYTMPDGPVKTMLGLDQARWLRRGLQETDAVFKFVVSSGPLRYALSDTWPYYSFERDALLRFILRSDIVNVIVIAGDVHYAAVVNHPEGIIGVSAGPLGHRNHNAAHLRGLPEVEFAYDGGVNFGMVQVEAVGERPAAHIDIRDSAGRLLFRKSVLAV
jgi:alkaline phosphatase D